MTVELPTFSIEISVAARSILLAGDIDVATASAIVDAADVLSTYPGDVFVDFSGVTFIDSAGVAAIITLHNALASRGGGVRLRGVHGPALRVFRLGGLESMLR